MIKNIPAEVVAIMENKEFIFYLTGSRYFGGFNQWSDWDLFAEDTEEIRQYLLDSGMQENTLERYKGDALNPSIFVLNEGWGSRQIHVQLYVKIDVKIKAQKIVPYLKDYVISPNSHFLSRKDREIWAIAYNIIATIQAEE